MHHLAEEAGTGIPRIIQTWRAMGFRMPVIDTGTERYEFTLGLRHAHLLSEDDRNWLHSLGDEWDEPEQLALTHAKHDGSINNRTLCRLAGLHPSDATKTLGNLRHRGLLAMEGSGRGTHYYLGPAAGGARASSYNSVPLFTDISDMDAETIGGSEEAIGGSEEAIGGSEETIGGLPSELRALAKTAREKRLDASARDELIIELCRRAPLSLRELSALLGRRESYIHKVVQPLVASGRLTYLYRDQPKHPFQKYVASVQEN